MPGRQSTGPPSLHKPKSKKKGKRALNALAIAEKVAPAQRKRRQNRLGESEDPKFSKRKRAGEDEDDLSEEEPAKRVRRRPGNQNDENIELGSDSSGNEWMTGQVDNDNDSELDSEEAMGESDEERFEGFAFRGSSSQTSTRKAQKQLKRNPRGAGNIEDIDLGEEEDEEDAKQASDAFGEDGVDLADVLDDDSEDRIGRRRPMSENQEYSLSEGDSKTRSSEEGSELEEQSVLSMSDDDPDSNDSSKLASLQNLVSTMDRADGNSRRFRLPDPQELMPPSEFGLTSERKLTVADFTSTVTDPELKRSLKLLADNDPKSSSRRGGIPKKLDVPLPKRQQDRIDRAAAYDKSKETLNRWVDTVKHHRRAEHLSFPLQDPDAVVPQGQNRLLPNTQSKPVTDLESTIQRIMQDSGLVAPDGKSGEDQIHAFEELKTNEMPIEEVLARRADLRRQRDLLFREEIRAKRIKKIKSKRYRKVHRKERERNAEQLKDALAADGEAESESEKERNDRRRAEERMGAKHRESKWAKGIRDSGRARWDDDAREGVIEMARRGEELRRRMEGKDVRGDDESEELSEDDDSDEDGERTAQPKLPNRLQKLLNSKIKDDGTGAAGSKLFEMDFMKKAQARSEAQNNVDVEDLRREIAGEDTPNEEEDVEGTGRKHFGPQRRQPEKPKPSRATERNEFEEPEQSDKEENVRRRKADVDIDRVVIDAGHQKTIPKSTSIGSELPRVEASEGSWNAGNGRNIKGPEKPESIQLGRESRKNNVSKFPRSALKGGRAAEKVQQDSHVLDRLNSPPLPQVAGAEAEQDDDSELEQPIVMTNADLARRAFAGDDVLDQKFLEEKDELTKDQDDQIIDNKLPGWGAWTGMGVSKKASKARARHREIKKISGIAPENRKDAKLKDVIISEKKVKKNAKYLAGQLPHPFETRAQYERSLRLPVGPEWTTKETFQGMTKPRVLMKQGVITPMIKPMA